MRSFDIVCRYGGDEFILVMPGSTLSDTLKRAEELRIIVENTDYTLDGQTFKASLSCGVAAVPDHGSTSKALLKAADEALYTAKKNERNNVASAATPK